MAILGYSTSITGQYVKTIGDIMSVGFSLSADDADTTSTLSKYSSSVPTTIHSNSIYITLYHDGAFGGETQNFVEEFKEKRNGYWIIDFPDGLRFSAQGYVSDVTVASSVDNAIILDVVIRLTGEPIVKGG